MKPNKLMAAALCAVACTFSTAIAEDDSGLESATPAAPVITDPVNPQPGMIFSAYGGYDWMNTEDKKDVTDGLQKSNFVMPTKSALATGIDKSDKFTIECAKGVSPYAIRWAGFLKCKFAKTYTFVIQKNYKTYDIHPEWCWRCGYSIIVNNRVFTSYGERSVDMELKSGFNKIEIFCLFPPQFREVAQAPLIISAKPKGSIIDPVKLSPGMLFYDARPELMESGL